MQCYDYGTQDEKGHTTFKCTLLSVFYHAVCSPLLSPSVH